MASWLPAVAAAALLAVAAASMTWPAPPTARQPTGVEESVSRGLPVVTGRSDDVFIQLGPVTSREINGPALQLMRVQLRRGMLGRLGLAASDIRASEIIEADVLFGEDGVARAIRFER